MAHIFIASCVEKIEKIGLENVRFDAGHISDFNEYFGNGAGSDELYKEEKSSYLQSKPISQGRDLFRIIN